MSDYYAKFTGTIDRRSPQGEGDITEPILRENWLCRDGRLRKPIGTQRAITTTLSDIPRWAGRYYTVEAGQITPKTFCYTEDGKIWVIDDNAKTATVIKSDLKLNAYPKHILFKTGEQTKLYLVDGESLYGYDGNNDNRFEKVNFVDSDGNSVKPIDLIEHKDRLCIISNSYLFISANLEPEVFNSATDSLQIIVGSGKGRNLAIGKIEDKLYVLNTEGIFELAGDVISVLASLFTLSLVEEKNILATRSMVRVEKSIIFLADDYELWSWDGVNSQMLSYKLKLKDFVNPYREMLDKAVAVYYNNYYMLSFVENGQTEPKLEVWWDAFENKIDLVRGRNVSCYMKTDPTQEIEYLQLGRSDIGSIMYADRGYNFDTTAITTKLRTRDLFVKKGENVRFTAFYPEIEPTGDRNIIITYLLDGRLSVVTGSGSNWLQNLRGEVKTLGTISIKNQAQFSSRIRPKINYSRGESIAFEISDSTADLTCDFLGIGIDFVSRGKSKGKTIGL